MRTRTGTDGSEYSTLKEIGMKERSLQRKTVMDESIIIIGGGLTGLAAGCYGRMNGYRTAIFEMHSVAGGVCTGWKRKGYTIDGAMNWLLGTKPETEYYRLWKELGATQHWQVYDHDLFVLTEDENHNIFHMCTDINRLEQQMMEIAPEDKTVISEYVKAIRDCERFAMPIDKPQELYGLTDYIKFIKMLPFLRFARKWGRISLDDYNKQFKSGTLRKILSLDMESQFGEMPMLAMFMMLSFLHQKEAGYVIGGALALVSYIQQRYFDLGGEIQFNSRVEKILVENDKAVGIRLADGTEHKGDVVISAADGRTTIFDMLGGKYIDDKISSYYDNLKLFPPLVYVGLGIARKFDDVPPSVCGLDFPLEQPVTVAGREYKSMVALVCNYDPTLSPEGKTVVKVQFDTDYDYWEELYREPKKYREEKERIADLVVEHLDKRFPGLAGQVEMRDVATPMTWVRYTGNWKGSYEGWMITKDTFMMEMSKTLPGLENFYMAGQWINPGGGMPTAVMSGNHTIQMICRKDAKPFVTSTP